VLDLLEVSSVIRIEVMGKLLAGSPEDNVIARAIEVAEECNTKKHGRERKHQSCNDHERKISEVSLTSAGTNSGVASHDRYFTFGSIGFEQGARFKESALELLK
jgi:hypothetical protein